MYKRQKEVSSAKKTVAIEARNINMVFQDFALWPHMKAKDNILYGLRVKKEEKDEMLNLAGKKRKAVAPDLPEYIMQRDYVSAALRTARDLDAGEEEWQRFVEELRKRKG